MPDPDSLDADLNRRSGARPPPRCADARVGVPRGRLSAPRRGRARACSTQSRRPSSKSQASSFPNVCGDRAIGHRQVGERVPRHPTLERAAASLVSIGDRHRLHDMPRRVPRARVGAAARSAVSHSRTKSPSKWRFRAGHDRRGRTAPARGHRSAARRPHIATKASSPLARSGRTLRDRRTRRVALHRVVVRVASARGPARTLRLLPQGTCLRCRRCSSTHSVTSPKASALSTRRSSSNSCENRARPDRSTR